MTDVPTPASVAGRARFGRRPAAARPPRTATPLPTGWDDSIALPMSDERHFFLDTGIYHSLACTFGVIGSAGAQLLSGHEPNATISGEAARQNSRTPLGTMASMLLPLMRSLAREACDLAAVTGEVETIRNELLADSRLRRPDAEVSPTAAAKHAGEAELIHLAERHEPVSVIFCNDAGASAIARMRGVSSAHFLHVLRAGVSAGVFGVDVAVGAATAGLSESQLQARERERTLNEAWLASGVSRPPGDD